MNHSSNVGRLRGAGALLTLGLGLAGAPAAAHAHQVWLEQDGKAARLCFGEYAENMREVSPGLLDKFASPTATLIGAKGEKDLTPVKSKEGYVLPARAGKGESLIAQDLAYPIIVRPAKAAAAGKPEAASARTLWTPAARFITDFRAQPAKLTLDIVPTGKAGEFQVVYRGKPLPEAKVDIAAASGWGREAETDAEGKVTFALPWKSSYLVKIHHVDATPGKRKSSATAEEAYDTASYSTSLAFATPTGLPAAPPPPAGKPHDAPATTATE
jgi:uncharacterized GH25 family protein